MAGGEETRGSILITIGTRIKNGDQVLDEQKCSFAVNSGNLNLFQNEEYAVVDGENIPFKAVMDVNDDGRPDATITKKINIGWSGDDCFNAVDRVSILSSVEKEKVKDAIANGESGIDLLRTYVVRLSIPKEYFSAIGNWDKIEFDTASKFVTPEQGLLKLYGMASLQGFKGDPLWPGFVTFLKPDGRKVCIGSIIAVDIDSAVKNGDLNSIEYTNNYIGNYTGVDVDSAVKNGGFFNGETGNLQAQEHTQIQNVTSDWVYRKFDLYDRKGMTKFKVLDVIPGPLDEKGKISAETSYLVIMPASFNGIPVKREVSGGSSTNEYVSDGYTLLVIRANSKFVTGLEK